MAQLNDWRDVLRPRLMHGLPERGRTILGEPGLGKPALVRKIATEAAREGDWVTSQIRVPSGSDPLKLVAGALLRLAHVARGWPLVEKGASETCSAVSSRSPRVASPGDCVKVVDQIRT